MVAVAALVTSDGRSLSTREFLEREAATLLPSDARVLSRRYHPRCYAFVVRESPPCLFVRFRVPGTVAARRSALLELAGSRWRVRVLDHRDGSDLRFSQGEVRARAYVRNGSYRRRCRSYRVLEPPSCEDSLRVEVGAPAVFPRLEIRYPPRLTR